MIPKTLLSTAQSIEDAQYGIAGIFSNLPHLCRAMGGPAVPFPHPGQTMTYLAKSISEISGRHGDNLGSGIARINAVGGSDNLIPADNQPEVTVLNMTGGPIKSGLNLVLAKPMFSQDYIVIAADCSGVA